MRSTIGIIGFSRSGKTTLAVALVRHFAARGERVAYVKHTHHAVGALGDEGDTHLARLAGASVVVAADEEDSVEWNAGGQMSAPEPYDDPAILVGSIDADLVVVEGWKDLRLWPVILVERAGIERLRPAPAIVAVVSDAESELPVPRFAPDDLAGIARFVDRIASV